MHYVLLSQLAITSIKLKEKIVSSQVLELYGQFGGKKLRIQIMGFFVALQFHKESFWNILLHPPTLLHNQKKLNVIITIASFYSAKTESSQPLLVYIFSFSILSFFIPRDVAHSSTLTLKQNNSRLDSCFFLFGIDLFTDLVLFVLAMSFVRTD